MKITRLTIALIPLLILTVGNASAQARPVARDSASKMSIQVQARRLVDANGKTIQLRGVNVSGLESGSILGALHPWDWSNLTSSPGSEPDWSKIAAWRGNVVRLPLNEASWLGLTTTDPESAQRKADPSGDYRATVVKSVNHAVAAGLYVILDLHWSAPGSFSANAQNPFMDSDHSLAFWASVANTFKNNPAVLFEPFNEPYLYPTSIGDGGVFPANQNWNRAIRDGALTASEFKRTVKGKSTNEPYTWTVVGFQAAINAIRATGATNVIILGGQGFDNDLTWWSQYPPTDPLNQLALAFHAYGPPTLGHGWGYDPTGNSTQYTGDKCVAILNAPGVPVILTEMGGAVGPGASTTYVNEILNIVDQQGWSVIAWTWNPWNYDKAGSNTLIQDITSYTPTEGLGRTFYNWTFKHN